MDRRRPAHTIAIAVAAHALLAGVAGDASAASRSGRQDPVASCDTAPGVTIRTGQRWRVFYPLLAGPDSSKQYVDVEGDEWACSRQPHSTRTFLDLGYWQGVRNLTGDLVQLDSYSRYGGFSSEIANLTTRKAQFVEQGDNYETDQPVNLLGSGAVALQSAPAAIFGTEGSGLSGYYGAAADGSVVRTVPTTPVDQTSWPRDKITRVVHHTFRGRPVPGLRATPILGGNLELDARRARRGKPASLAAVDVNSGHRHPRSIVARLVPGSEAETSTPAAGVIVGRFLDHPSELRTRFFANDGSLIDLPAPVAGASNPIVRSGTIAVATADAITLQVPAYDGERGTTLVVPAPGATDLALTYDPGGVLYYRDAAGNPARFAFTPAP